MMLDEDCPRSYKGIIERALKRVKDSPSIVTDRWEQGKEHHPLSELIVTVLAELDFKFYNDYFGIKIGGDGDNGETMMYILDSYFDELGGQKDVRQMLELMRFSFMSMCVD